MTREPLMTPAQAAERLNCARGTVYAAISKGELQAYRVGRARRISDTQLRNYLERRSNEILLAEDF